MMLLRSLLAVILVAYCSAQTETLPEIKVGASPEVKVETLPELTVEIAEPPPEEQVLQKTNVLPEGNGSASGGGMNPVETAMLMDNADLATMMMMNNNNNNAGGNGGFASNPLMWEYMADNPLLYMMSQNNAPQANVGQLRKPKFGLAEAMAASPGNTQNTNMSPMQMAMLTDNAEMAPFLMQNSGSGGNGGMASNPFMWEAMSENPLMMAGQIVMSMMNNIQHGQGGRMKPQGLADTMAQMQAFKMMNGFGGGNKGNKNNHHGNNFSPFLFGDMGDMMSTMMFMNQQNKQGNGGGRNNMFGGNNGLANFLMADMIGDNPMMAMMFNNRNNGQPRRAVGPILQKPHGFTELMTQMQLLQGLNSNNNGGNSNKNQGVGANTGSPAPQNQWANNPYALESMGLTDFGSENLALMSMLKQRGQNGGHKNNMFNPMMWELMGDNPMMMNMFMNNQNHQQAGGARGKALNFGEQLVTYNTMNAMQQAMGGNHANGMGTAGAHPMPGGPGMGANTGVGGNPAAAMMGMGGMMGGMGLYGMTDAMQFGKQMDIAKQAMKRGPMVFNAIMNMPFLRENDFAKDFLRFYLPVQTLGQGVAQGMNVGGMNGGMSGMNGGMSGMNAGMSGMGEGGMMSSGGRMPFGGRGPKRASMLDSKDLMTMSLLNANNNNNNFANAYATSQVLDNLLS